MPLNSAALLTPTNHDQADRRRSAAYCVVAACLVLMLTIVGCRGGAEDTGSEDHQAPPANATADVATTSTAAPPVMSDDRQLIVWVPAFVAAGEDSPAAEVLTGVLVQFEQAHPNTDVEIVLKSQGGTADVLNYLRSAQRVAPAILPDLVLLETQDLWRTVDLGLAQPLEVDLSSFGSLFPFTLEAVRYQDRDYGVPFALDVLHGVATGENALPSTWDELLADGVPYIFAGAQTDPALNLTLMLQYMTADGRLSAEPPSLSPETMELLLEFYSEGLTAGIIPQENATLADSSAVWRELDLDTPMVGLISARTLLGQRDALSRITYGPAPSQTGTPYALATTYAFAILATEPDQVALAVDLLRSLVEPTVHGEWSQFAHVLPSTSAALSQWGTSQDYFGFLDALLRESSNALPNSRVFYEYARRVQAIQYDVLSGRLSSEEALADMLVAP